MTIKLIRILSDLSTWTEDWTAGAISTEQEFVEKIAKLNKGLGKELLNQKNYITQES